MKKPYEIPEVELIVLRPNAAIAYLPGTDSDKYRSGGDNEDNIGNVGSIQEEGGVGTIPGGRG